MVLCSEANKSFFQNVLLNFSKKIAAGGNPLHGASYCLTLLPLKTASKALPFFKSFDQTFLKVCRRRHCDALQGRMMMGKLLSSSLDAYCLRLEWSKSRVSEY
jgi:hypothetical protein